VGHKIYLEVRQPHKGVPTSSLLRWPLRSESLSPPCLPQSNHKGHLRFPLRRTGWYKHFGGALTSGATRATRRTHSQLGFQEPKSNKYESDQLEREPSAQVASRSFPLSNLTSLAQILQGLNLGARGDKERVSQCLGALFTTGESQGMRWVTVRSEGESYIYLALPKRYRYYWWYFTGTTGP
jgi:hypothetical protein